MKKVLLAVCLLLASGVVFGVDMMFGGRIGYEGSSYNINVTKLAGYTVDPAWVLSDNFGQVNFGAFLDTKYFRVDLGFSSALSWNQNIGDLTINGITLKGTNMQATNLGSFSTFDITLLAKYPFEMKGFSIWPAAGLQYSLLTSFTTKDGVNLATKDKSGDAFNDFYLMLGGGLDVNLADSLVFEPSLLFGINLTPKEGSNDDPSNSTFSYSGTRLLFSIALGYKF